MANPFTAIWQWFQSVWHRDSVKKAIEFAKTAADGLTTDQFHVVVDQVVAVSKEQIPGLEKAAKVEQIVTSPDFSAKYQLPDWAKNGISVASTVIKVAWFVAKLRKLI